MVVGIVTTRVLLMLTATGGADAADWAGADVAIAVSVAAARSARLVAAARICGTPMSFPHYCTAVPGLSERPSAPHTIHLPGAFANGNSLRGSGGPL
jgi:hypothetical protein